MSLANLLPTLQLVAIVAAIVIFWRKGGNDADTKATAAYKNVTDAQEKEINQLKQQMKEQSETFRAEINALTSKVGELTGIIKEKNDRIKTLEEIATNRNPEMIALMTDVRNHLQNGNALLTSLAAMQSAKVAS